MGNIRKPLKPISVFFIFILILSMTMPIQAPAAEEATKLQPYLAEMVAASPDKMVRVIVQKADETDRAEKFAEKLGGQIYADLGIIDGFAALILGSKVEALASHASVQWVSYDAPMASSALPNKVYYSVGTNIGNLRNGTPTMTIDSGVATFSTAQWNYVGVGDKITYNTTSIAYISERINATTFRVVTNKGATSANVTNATVNSIKRTFNKLSTAIVNAYGSSYLGTKDLVTGNYQLNFPCYKDATMVDKVWVDDYTTSAVNNIRIYTPYLASEVGISQRHAGRAGTGFVLTPSSGNAFMIKDGYVTVDGLEIIVPEDYVGLRVEGSANGEVFISNNILHGNMSLSGISSGSIDVSATIKIWNNIFYHFRTGIRLVDSARHITGYIFNNSIFNVWSGISNDWNWATLTTKNNIILTCADYCFYRAGTQTYNISSDSTATGTGSLIYKTASNNFTNITTGSEDLHLKSTSDALGKGADLDQDAQIPIILDIDGGDRPTTSPEIGADEYAVAYVAPPPEGPDDPPTTNTFRTTLGVNQLSTVNGSPLLGSTATITIVDSGITYDPDFDWRIQVHISGVPGEEYILKTADNTSCQYCDNIQDHFGHGTHVAGIAGGSGADSNGLYKGIAPDADIINFRVMDENGMAYESNIVDSLDEIMIMNNEWLPRPIKVVNISINSTVEQSYNDSPLCAAVEILWFHGIVVVTSAGNTGGVITPPANDPYVITVGATDEHKTTSRVDDTIPSWSAKDVTIDGFAKPDIYAPGANIISTLSTNATWKTDYPDRVLGNGQYFRMSGTSMAAPMVAGAVAVLSDLKDLTPDQIKYALINTGTTINSNGQTGKYLDILAAANYVYNTINIPSANQSIMPHLLLRQTALIGYYATYECEDPVETCDMSSVDWNSVNWNSVNWNSVNWNSVNWNSVNWNSVNWNSVNWNSVNWNSVNWNSVNWNSVNWNSTTWESAVNWNSVNWNSVNWNSMIFE